jgi:hypothetical protein
MRKTEVGVILVTDKSGNISVGAAQNPDSPIRLGGSLTTADGRPTDYYGRAEGVEKWAVDNGMEYELYVIEIDLDERRVLGGRYERK